MPEALRQLLACGEKVVLLKIDLGEERTISGTALLARLLFSKRGDQAINRTRLHRQFDLTAEDLGSLPLARFGFKCLLKNLGRLRVPALKL